MYFSSNKEKIDNYSKDIQKVGEAIITLGKLHIDNKIFGKKKLNEIREPLIEALGNFV